MVNKDKRTSTFECTCSIRDFIKHVTSKTKKACKNTKYASNYFFYYDTLVQMNNDAIMHWIKEEDILKY